MPGTLCPVVGVPTHGMSVRQPTKERGKLLVRFSTDHEMPMIGHREPIRLIRLIGLVQTKTMGLLLMRWLCCV